jgi:hypothetical protein
VSAKFFFREKHGRAYKRLVCRSIDTDDFAGHCDDSINFDTFNDFRTKPKVKLNIPKRTDKNYPLLRTINDAIRVTVDEMVQEENLVKENEIINNQDNADSSGNQQSSPSKTAAPVAFSLVALCAVAIAALKL